MSYQNLSSLIWNVAELIRGPYKPFEYGKVILPFTVLRRLDCTLQSTKDQALAEHERRESQGVPSAQFLPRITGYSFFNTSKLDLTKLLSDPNNVKVNLESYIGSFSENVTDIFEKFAFASQISRLVAADLLYLVTREFARFDLHPDIVSNADMGQIFEELIRRFSEASNETAGDHFTPREVIRLMVNLLFLEDSEALTKPGAIRTLNDPTAGTGGMLSIAQEHLGKMNPQAKLVVSGQEFNEESYAICKADMLIRGHNVSKIIFGNTLSSDGHAGAKFDYGLSNPPFGVDWKNVQKAVDAEHEKQGFNGRFGPGLPRLSDGSLLFLLHLISKMQPTRNVNGVTEGGGRVAIVLNGSPLFTGGAGSGESDIRKWVIENDLLDAIIALPTDMFYNTGISTYIWVLCNHKSKERRGKIQLINAVDFFQKMRKSLGSKRKELGDADIDRITKIYGDFQEGDYCKIFDGRDFGYSTITVERPLRLSFTITEERLALLRQRLSIIKSGLAQPGTESGLAPTRRPYDSPGQRPGNVTGSREEALKGRAKDTGAAVIVASSLKEDGALAKLPQIDQLVLALQSLPADKKWLSREVFAADADAALKKAVIALSAPQWKALINTLGEQDDEAEICLDSKKRPEPSADLRDTENVPLKEDIQAYFEREVLPHVPDAWIDHSKTKVGYEIPFTRHFYKFVPPRSLEEIDQDLKTVTSEILELLREVTHEA